MNFAHTLFHRLSIAGLSLCLSSLLLACAATDAPSLYTRLGGEKGLTTLVDRTINRAAQDPRTLRSFDGIKLATVKLSIVKQLCSLSGGGCTYEGETMARSHKDLKISASEFDALVDILREELDRAEIGAAAKNQLLSMLAPMKRDIAPQSP
nr:group 1 truncated hemoglobin [uncultured Roseateles sp.]